MEQQIPPADNQEALIEPHELRKQRQLMIGIIAIVLIILALIIVSVILLLRPTTDTARVRDIFIIFMALESLVLGLALVILIIQLARLINLLQNEIKPILESTNETVSTLRGTTNFLSDHMVEPVIKANEYVAGLRQALTVLGITRNRPKKPK
jgi:nitrate reductase gamma subunit